MANAVLIELLGRDIVLPFTQITTSVKTHTTDSFVVRRLNRTHTTDSILRKNTSIAHATDTVLVSVTTAQVISRRYINVLLETPALKLTILKEQGMI